MMNILCVGRCFPASEFFKKNKHKLKLVITKTDFVQAEYEFDYDNVYVIKEIPNAITSIVDVVGLWNDEEKIDAICCYNDTYFDLVIELAERYGIRSVLSRKAIENTHDKSKTREILAQCNLPSAQYAIVDDAYAAQEFMNRIAQPVIFKPLAAFASIGVSRIDNHEDINQAIQALEQQGQSFPALMESFLQGEEFSVESFSEANEHRILAITKKYKYGETFIEQGHAISAELDKDTEAKIIDYIVSVLTALEIENGPAHSEIILTESGPVLVESHARVGGDLIHEIIHLATGVDVLEFSARQVLGESVLDEIPEHLPKKQSAAVWFAFPDVDKETDIECYEGKTSADDLEGIETFKLMKQSGSKVAKVENSFDRLAVAVATGHDLSTALTHAQMAISQLKPKYRK